MACNVQNENEGLFDAERWFGEVKPQKFPSRDIGGKASVFLGGMLTKTTVLDLEFVPLFASRIWYAERKLNCFFLCHQMWVVQVIHLRLTCGKGTQPSLGFS